MDPLDEMLSQLADFPDPVDELEAEELNSQDKCTIDENQEPTVVSAIRAKLLGEALEIKPADDFIKDESKLRPHGKQRPDSEANQSSLLFADGADSDDDELDIHKKELSASGKQLEQWMKRSRTVGIDQMSKSKEPEKARKKTILTGVSDDRNANNSSILSPSTNFDKSADFCAAFDKFNIAIRNPKISSQTFASFTASMESVRLSDLRPTTSFKNAWCTMGVIVEKGLTKKSGNGNEYLIWRLHDLKDCQSQTTKLLMFGDAIKEHWKLPVGCAVALVSAQMTDDASSSSQNGSKPSGKGVNATLKVSKGTQIVEIGIAHHFGVCKGKKQDGNLCSNFVNRSLSEYCVYHVMSAAKKLSANRGTFNALTCGPNMGGLVTGKATTSGRPKSSSQAKTAGGTPFHPLPLKTVTKTTMSMKPTTKEEEKTVLNDFMATRKHSLATRQLMKLKEKQCGPASPVHKSASFSDFIQHEELNVVEEQKKLKVAPKKADDDAIDLSEYLSPSTSSPKPIQNPGFGVQNANRMPVGARDAQEHIARVLILALGSDLQLRAVAFMKKQRTEADGGVVKRKLPDLGATNAAKKAKVDVEMDEIKKLLCRKSLHHQAASQEESDRLQRHLSGMEERERVETFTTTCMAIKNVRVVSCKQCKYTSATQSELCREAGHDVVRHDAEKRFFKCAACKTRTVCYELLPLRPCGKCNESKWVRVAMRDERKVVLDTEKLQLRGEERKNVNT